MKKVDGVREASLIVSNVFNSLYDYIKLNNNITTYDIDEFCNNKIIEQGARSAAYNYQGEYCKFPRYTCISINNEICHGIPNKNRIVQIGDIISIDICVEYKGFYGDSCITFIYRKALNNIHLHLVRSSYDVMMSAINIVKPMVQIGTLGYVMEHRAKKLGYSVIEDFAGHYIGNKLHLNPLIPFFGKKNTGNFIQEDDTFTIEPMIVDGSNRIGILQDGWTAVSIDGAYSAQFEHTILVTKNGYEILTLNKFTDLLHFII